MSGFLRRVAGAFVEFQDEPRGGKGGGGGGMNLDALTDDAAELLAQLEDHTSPGPVGGGGPSPGGPSPAGGGSGGGGGGGGAGGPSAGEAMSMNADDVFRSAGIPDGPNSSERLLRIIAGLTMFPPEQQVVMVRAMDQADETWAEPSVLEDARTRQAALRSHLQRIEGERALRIQQLREQIAATQAEGKSLCDDIDARIAELMARREEAVVHKTAAVAELEGHIQRVEGDADRARNGISHVIGALGGLLNFFGASPDGQGPH
jgi:hypothetical protein